MISKCENIVINRTKFSEFSDFDPALQGVDGLKLVGYLDNENGKRNVSVDYGALLKKNGETATVGQYVRAGAIGDYSFITKNELCGELSGLKIDASDLDFIEIDWSDSTPWLHVTNGYLPISFAHSSYSLGQECALFFHNIAANICIYMPILGAENAIYNEIDTEELAGHTVNVLIIFTKVIHAVYGEVLVPTRTFVAEDNKAFHVYAPTIVKEEISSPIARMLPASNANLDAVATRVSSLEAGQLQAMQDITATNNKITTAFEDLANKIDSEITETNATITSEISAVKDEIEKVTEGLEDKIEEVTEDIKKNASETAADLAKILHVVKFESKDELNRWISELVPATKVKELSRTIALIRQENDTYEEYVCVNPDQADGNPLEWDRLGAVDSIYATHEMMGSVQLVHDVTEGTIDTYIDTNIAGDIYPKKGLAVAPIALKDLYNKHNANVASITDALTAIEETKNAVEVINKELEIKTDADETTSSRIDSVDSSIEYLKDVIGLNGCHSGTACANKHCEDITGKCTILCRVTENENDISNISSALAERTDEFQKATKANAEAIETISQYIDTEIDELEKQIGDINTNFVKNEALEELKTIIGLNGCHNNSSCSQHHCEDISGECTILCRIHENESDISKISSDIAGIDNNIEILKNSITAAAEYVDGKFEEVQSKFTVCNDELKRIDAIATTNKDNIAEVNNETHRIAAELTRIETSELTALKDTDATLEATVSRLDSDINKQITTIAALETDIAEVRTGVESNAAANSEAHSNIITRLTKLESDYTSDKTYKEIAETNMIYGTQAYNEVIVVKSTVDELKNIVHNNSAKVTNVENRIATAENLVNDCNEQARFAITTATNANEKAISAETKSDRAIHNSTEAVRIAELAKDDSEHVVAEVEDLIKGTQNLHSMMFSFKQGSPSGEFIIKCAEDFTIFDSVYYNFAVVETRSNGQVIYPSVEFSGSIDANKAEGREIKVTTERENEATLITILAYRAEQHVIEK